MDYEEWKRTGGNKAPEVLDFRTVIMEIRQGVGDEAKIWADDLCVCIAGLQKVESGN